MKFAVIPARGGSKRIHRKNIREFCGKPMIAWSIEAALESDCFDRVIVSTDDAEIAKVACEWGAETPFVRPAKLSNDHVGTLSVVNHAIDWFSDNNVQAELVCCLYATAPFARAEDLRRGLEVLSEQNSDYAFSVTSFPFPIQRALRIENTGLVSMFMPEHANTRSQDLDEAWHDAGQFYWGKTEAWLAERPLFSEYAAPVLLPRYRVQDIDTPEDWRRAELMFQVLQNDSEQPS